MANQLIRTPFTINSTSTGVTFMAADLATANSWNTILTYSVPLGVAIEVLPTNYFFFDLKATDTTTRITAGLSRVIKQNANGTETRELFSGSNGIFKDIGDEFQRPKFKVGVTANSSQQILCQVYGLGTSLDSIASNVFIECLQWSEQL